MAVRYDHTSVSAPVLRTSPSPATTRLRLVIRFAIIITKMPPPGFDVVIDIPPCNHVIPDDEGHDTLLETRHFAVDQVELTSMMRDKNMDLLVNRFHGVKGLADLLRTHLSSGLFTEDDVDIVKRREWFGFNKYTSPPPPKSLASFVGDAARDPMVVMLLVCAALALGFGIKQHGLREGWSRGASVVLAVFLVVAVSVFSKIKRSRKDRDIDHYGNGNGNDVEVVRNGRNENVASHDVVVGDIVCLKSGVQVPADGLFLDGESLTLTDSVFGAESDNSIDPFLFAGTKVSGGRARMLVTSVGMNTGWGEKIRLLTMTKEAAAVREQQTPLENSISELACKISKFGLVFAALVVAFGRHQHNKEESDERYMNSNSDRFARALNTAVAILVVAMTEVLSLAVTLALAHSADKTRASGIRVRKLRACENMGAATVMCVDKTGVITLSQDIRVVEIWTGREEISSVSTAHKAALKLIKQGIFGFDTHDCTTSHSTIERAILSWAVSDLDADRVSEVINVEEFDSEKRRSGVVLRDKSNENEVHIHLKGAPETVLSTCSCYYDNLGAIKTIKEEEREHLQSIINSMTAKSLSCIAFAHKKIQKETYRFISSRRETEMTWLGIVGLENTCRPETKEAVESCIHAGISVVMVTGDDLETAKAIALRCGILDNGVAIEGAEFNRYSAAERMHKVNSIRVMARASPYDKASFLCCLKKIGHVVAYMGHSEPALREADVAISTKLQAAEAEEWSDLSVSRDGDMKSTVEAVKWGRCVYSNIQRFLQFQLTVNPSALVINFLCAVSTGNIPLSAVQLAWVTLGTSALSTLQSSDYIITRPADRTNLITKVMWRNIIGQILYQVSLIMLLHLNGFGGHKVKDTFVFNVFVLCQVFNALNARRLEEKNIFKGMLKNKSLLGVAATLVILQVLMIEFLDKFADTQRLDLGEWALCIVLAALCCPFAWLVKCIPVSDS